MTLTDHQQRVMEVLIQHPEGLTAWEIAQQLKEKPRSCKVFARLKSLSKWGFVEKAGERKNPRCGLTASVWRVIQ